MNCEDMVKIPELENVLLLRAGAGGMKNIVRWIYFADCLQCVQSEYKVEDYIHGGEFVILTNRSVTDNKDTLIGLIGKMLAHGISALGINEGQISDELIQYADGNDLPLFELPEKYPLIDLSQILCNKLVLEENNKNLEEQLFTSILDSEHLNRESILAQARYLNVDFSGGFCVVEFALKAAQNQNGDSLALGRELRHIISMEFSFYTASDILMLSQTGSVLALVSSERIKEEDLKMLNELADALGAQIAGTRPTIECGWVDPKKQIGLSGRTVKPKLIITCGVSGAVQFVAGMKGSDYIIAINQDEKAPIFDVAHLGIIGDIYEIIPKLTEKIKAMKNEDAQKVAQMAK